MFKSIVAASALLLSATSFANESNFSAGTGFQFGGVIGVKYAIDVSENSRVFASAGLIGGAIGYEYAFSENNAVSLSLGSEVIVSEKGFIMLDYNHYFDGRNNSGWHIGGGIGITREDLDGLYGSYGETDTKGNISFVLGYQF